jgi:large subunit ribosomal protein L19
MNKIKIIEFDEMRMDIPTFRPGDTVKVFVKIQETEEKERIQMFEGIVIAMRGSGINETFTVRKNSFGVGVERIFHLHSPRIDKVEVVQEGRHNRAKLFYIRNLSAKAIRQKLRSKTQTR